MNNRVILILGLALAFANVAFANEEVVKRFEKLTLSFTQMVNSQEAKISPPTGSVSVWYRRKIYVRDVAYDVRRTDSLVSPFAGEIFYVCGARGAKGLTELEVKTAPEQFDTGGGKCRANYAFQSSRWVFKAATCYDHISKKTWQPVEDPSQGIYYDCKQLLPQE